MTHSLLLRSKRDAGLKMRKGRDDSLEISERLEQVNEEDYEDLSQLCGTYVGFTSVVWLKCHTILGATP
jgi:hypothetical protein